MLSAWIDDSEEQDQKVLCRTLSQASELPLLQTIERPEIRVCQEMWGMLFASVWVVIPFAEQIRFNSASNRRNPDMLIDLIRSHAIMNQFQRNREEMNGTRCVTATMDDFTRACTLYSQLCGDSGGQTTKMTRKEAELIVAIRSLDQNEITISQLQRITQLSYNTIYKCIHGNSSRGVSYSGLLEKCPALSYIDRTVSDDTEGQSVKRRTKAYQWDSLLYDCWSNGDKCWISSVQSTNASDDDSDNNDDNDDRSFPQLLQPADFCSNKSEDNPSSLDNNNQNNNNSKVHCNRTGEHAILNDSSVSASEYSRDFMSAARSDPISSNNSQNAECNPHDSENSLLQDLQPAGKAGRVSPVNDNHTGFVPCSPGSGKGSCLKCHAPFVSYESQDGTVKICKTCYDRMIRKEVESIRTLPGTLNLAGMRGATTDYGRCKVCDLQGVTWWDQDTKTGLCQTCYEREMLLGRGRF